MARRKPLLTVIVAPEAEDELDEIYRYNISERGLTVASRYVTFLKTRIASLALDYDEGQTVQNQTDLRYLVLKQRMRRWKDGHIAVYNINEKIATVEVLHIFHTKQDWESRLKG
jgi:plasmid stabilization system protein ParE